MILPYDVHENQKQLDALLLQELMEKTGKTSRREDTISLAFEENGEYVGGIIGNISFESCYVDLLAVKKDFRGRGIAKYLLKEMEHLLRKQGITTVFLNTQHYQAKDFYLKMQYELVAQMEDIPFRGTTRYYFVKHI